MPTQDYRDLAVDNFIFRIKNGLWYSRTGAWVAVDTAASVARVGLSDFYQQSSGGIVFVELLPVGTAVVQDTEFAHLETANGDREVPSPATGSILRVNPLLADAPELINQDPYGDGWLADVRLANWERDQVNLLDAAACCAALRPEAEELSRRSIG